MNNQETLDDLLLLAVDNNNLEETEQLIDQGANTQKKYLKDSSGNFYVYHKRNLYTGNNKTTSDWVNDLDVMQIAILKPNYDMYSLLINKGYNNFNMPSRWGGTVAEEYFFITAMEIVFICRDRGVEIPTINANIPRTTLLFDYFQIFRNLLGRINTRRLFEIYGHWIRQYPSLMNVLGVDDRQISNIIANPRDVIPMRQMIEGRNPKRRISTANSRDDQENCQAPGVVDFFTLDDLQHLENGSERIIRVVTINTNDKNAKPEYQCYDAVSLYTWWKTREQNTNIPAGEICIDPITKGGFDAASILTVIEKAKSFEKESQNKKQKIKN